MDVHEIERKCVEANLNAPRITAADLEQHIESTEIVKFVTAQGKVLRWAVLNTKSGYGVTGKPSCAMSIENDNEKLGTDRAFNNAYDELRSLLAFARVENAHQQQRSA